MSILTSQAPMKITGKHVLLTLLGFFGTVISVNVLFVFLALDTWTGLTSGRSYQEGLAYNDIIRDAESQRALGWTSELTVTPREVLPGEVTVAIEVRMSDAAGAPLALQSLTLAFRHPMAEKLDQVVPLAMTAPGRYGAEAVLETSGNWDLRLIAAGPNGETFRRDDAVWIK